MELLQHTHAMGRATLPRRRGALRKQEGGRLVTSLEGKVAIVTGGSREIGAAMAEALAGAGAAVVARIRAAGRQAQAVQADLSSVADNQRLVAQTVEAFGRLDIFVANAGLTMWGPFLEVASSTWDTVVDLNLKGSFFGSHRRPPRARWSCSMRLGTPLEVGLSFPRRSPAWWHCPTAQPTP